MADTTTTDPEPLLLDLRGLRCPLPALKTRKALSRMASRRQTSCSLHRSSFGDRHPPSPRNHRRRARERQSQDDGVYVVFGAPIGLAGGARRPARRGVRRQGDSMGEPNPRSPRITRPPSPSAAGRRRRRQLDARAAAVRAEAKRSRTAIALSQSGQKRAPEPRRSRARRPRRSCRGSRRRNKTQRLRRDAGQRADLQADPLDAGAPRLATLLHDSSTSACARDNSCIARLGRATLRPTVGWRIAANREYAFAHPLSPHR